MKSAALRLAPLLLLIVANTMLLYRTHSDTRKQSAEWKQLEAQVDRKIERLKALATELAQASEELDQKSDKLKGEANALRSHADSLSNLVPADKSASNCAIVHKSSSGCPRGYALEKHPRFTERDGSKEFACVSEDPSKEQCTDVLKSGESMEMFFTIPMPGSEPTSTQPKI